MNINLGSGAHPRHGFVNVDQNPLTTPDVVHDLNRFPYPFADASADHIQAFHIIEHLEDPFSVMRELHRILKPGGTLHIRVPHCSRGFTHSQHKSGFDIAFPLYFNKKFIVSGYFGVDFLHQSSRLHYLANLHLLQYIGIGRLQLVSLKLLDACVSFLANRAPFFCSRFWCFWVGGFDEIEFVFKKPPVASPPSP